MQDLVIKGTGNSRYLKSISNFLTQYPTYADFVSALVAGTLPIDLNGINSAGVTTIGTPLNKNNLLKDSTASAYGFGSNATIDQILAAIKNTVIPNASVASATNATNAANTDFTNANWTTVPVGTHATLVEDATYEVQVNDGETDKWFVFPIVTLVYNSRIETIAFAGSPTSYINFTCYQGDAVVTTNSTWQYSDYWRYRRIR